MPSHADSRNHASVTYNAASDSYDAAPLTFWSYFGHRTVQRLGLHTGEHVLDVASGSGASALPAAEAVGQAGSVVAVDLAEKLLALARTKSKRLGLENIAFKQADLMTLDQPDRPFDAVICVFGIFFIPDMVAAISKLWRMVRPEGKLAITTWGQGLFEPANTVFWNSIHKVRPDLERKYNPWDRIGEPTALRNLLEDAGVTNIELESENRLHPITGPDDWWTIVCGTGYRGTLEKLDPIEYEMIRQFNIDHIRQQSIQAVQTNAIYAIGRKPPN